MDSQSYTQFQGQLLLMFDSQGKHHKPASINTSMVIVGTGEDVAPLQESTHNSQTKVK